MRAQAGKKEDEERNQKAGATARMVGHRDVKDNAIVEVEEGDGRDDDMGVKGSGGLDV